MKHCLQVFLLAALFSVGASLQAAYPTLYLKPVVLGQLHSPTNIIHAGDGSGRVFVTDQPGRIYIIEGGMLRPTPFLDITSKVITLTTGYSERGLLGLAFHPDYETPATAGYRKFYVYYSKSYVAGTDPGPPLVGEPVDHAGVLAEFQVSATDPNVADPNTERRLIVFTQPQSNHNGGQLEFGPDGYLYFGLGDGGQQNDNAAGHTGGSAGKPAGALGNSQDRTRILGKILRLDPLGNNGPGGLYGIPADNPFVGAGSGIREEIWALGMRNPWRFSFDRGPGGTGRLFCTDVGQNKIEEVDIITKGGNYGWRIKEGTIDHDATAPNPSGIALTPPIAEYAHPGATGVGGAPPLGLSGTGGYVYRGTAIPGLQGKYVFGDYGATSGSPSGRLMGLEETAENSGVFTLTQAIPVLGGNPFSMRLLCLGEDGDGELYLGTKISGGVLALDNGLPNGGIYKLTPVPTNPAPLALEPVRDNSLFAETGGGGEELSNATGNLFAGTSSDGNTRRALMAFDLSALPASARFASAIIQVNVNQIEGGTVGQRNSLLYKVTESWGEGTSFSTTGGTLATTNDASWLNRFYSATTPTLWTTEGGTYNSAASASTAIATTGGFSWQGLQVLKDVHEWLSAPATNQGWLLRSDEGINSTTKRIDSRESAIGSRPTLTLVYATPHEKWLATHIPGYLTGQYFDPSGDLDGDGLGNQIEYAYGFSPFTFDPDDNFSVSVSPPVSGTSTLSVTFRRDTAATDLRYQLQISSNLQAWTTFAESIAGAAVTGLNGGTASSDLPLSGTIQLVTATYPLTGPAADRHFVRLAILRTP